MFKSKLLPTTILVAAASVFSVSQAQAHGDAAAVLVGVAVGGLTTYALQNAHRHHGGGHGHHGHHRGGHGHHGHHVPKRVEHYVIHNPPQYQERRYERVSNRGHRGRGGYEYEYEYSRRGF